jgi:hypothetical protein
MLLSTAALAKGKRPIPASTRSVRVQLNLRFLNLPLRDSQIWETLDDTHKQLVTSVITRILIKAVKHDNTNTVAAAESDHSQSGSNHHE